MNKSVADSLAPSASQAMWATFKARMDFISGLGILESEVIKVDFFIGHRLETDCLVQPPCFLRLAERFDIKSLEQVAYGDDQLFFIEQGVEFSTVLSVDNRKRFAQELNAFEIIRNERP